MKVKQVLLLCLLLTLLCGCYDTLNVDDQSYPVAVGIDIGEEKNYKISLHIPVQKKSDSGAENTSEIVETEVDNLYEVKSKLDSVNPWILNFSHLSYIIASKEIAESGTLAQLIEDAEKSFLLKKSAVLIVANGEAGKFMEGLNDETLTPDQVLNDLFIQQMASGTLYRTNVNKYMESVAAHRMDAPVALGTYTYKNESIASRLEGSALFFKGTMVGMLTPEETQLLLIGMGQFRSGNFSPEQFDGDTSFRLIQMQKPRVEFSEKGPLRAAVQVFLRCELYTHQGETTSIDYAQAEQEITDYLTDALNDVFAFCTRLKCDALGLGRYAVKNYWYESQWKESDWEERERTGEIAFDVELRFGWRE